MEKTRNLVGIIQRFIKKQLNIIKNQKVNSFFSQLMISYTIVLFLTLGISLIAYNISLRTLKEEQINLGISKLKQSISILDSRLIEIESLAVQLTYDRRIIEFYNLSYPLKPEDYYKAYILITDFPKYRLTNNFIEDIMIYFKKSGTIFTTTQITTRTRMFYEGYLHYTDLNYDNWIKEVTEHPYSNDYWPAMEMEIGNNKGYYVTYLQSMRVDSTNIIKGTIMVLIDEKRIHEHLDGLGNIEDGWIYITDVNDNLITSKNISRESAVELSEDNREQYTLKKDGVKLTVIQATSEYNNWTYVQAIPSSILMHQANYVLKVNYISVFSILIAGIIIALLLARKDSKPIKDLQLNLSSWGKNIPEGKVNEIKYIKSTLKQLMAKNQSLEIVTKNVEEQKLFLERCIIDQLIRGNIFKENELDAALKRIGISSEGSSYVVILIKVLNFHDEITEEVLIEMDIIRAIIGTTLNDTLENNSIIHSISFDEIAIIIGFDTNSMDEKRYKTIIDTEIDKMIKRLQSKSNILINVGIGRKYNFSGISDSFNESKKAVEQAVNAIEYRKVWYKDNAIPFDGYSYTLQQEIKIIELTRIGAEREVEAEINKIYIDNCFTRNITHVNFRYLVNQLIGTTERLKQQLINIADSKYEQLNSLVDMVYHSENNDEAFETIHKIFQNLCDIVNERKKSHHRFLCNNILNYIKVNIADANLSLYVIAKEFNLSEKYLSDFFKEQTSYNFSHYIEDVRLSHAIKLLESSKKSIKDIAYDCGYAIINTFYRAFKRKYDMSPSEYRRKKLM